MLDQLTAIRSRFGLWDYGVLAVILALSLSIGLFQAYKARRRKDPTDFLMANRKAGLLPLTMSSVATYLSAVTLMGLPSEVYASGIQYTVAWVASVIGYAVAAYLFMPIFHKLHLTSIMEYLELRYNRRMRMLGAGLTVLGLLLYTAFVIYLPALAINQVTGIHLWTVTAALGVICICYTALGGLRAVIWTDVFQVIVMVLSVILLLVMGTMDVGGIGQAWKANYEGDRTTMFRFLADPTSRYTFWSLFLGQGLNSIHNIGLNYVMVQRQLATSSIKDARKCLFWGCLGNFVIAIPCIFLGLVVYAKYATCDPKAAGIITSWDQLTPLFSVEVLGFLPGLPGIYMGGILCATLSTMSSTINTLCLIVLEDFVRPFRPTISDSNAVVVSKVLAFIIGGLTLLLVLIAQQLGTIIQAMYLTNALTHSVLVGIFTLGVLVPWTSTLGATIGCVVGSGVTAWIVLGVLVTGYNQPTSAISTEYCVDMYNVTVPPVQNIQKETFALYTISPPWYVCIGSATVIVVGMIASLLTGPKQPLKHGMLSPTAERVFQRLPLKWKKLCGFQDSIIQDVSIELKNGNKG